MDEGADGLLGSQDIESPVLNTTTTEEVCEVIDFNTYAHGDAVTSASVFGLSLTVSADRYPPASASGIAPTAFDTNLDTGPDPDLRWQNGQCPDCEGLDRVLVIPDPDFAAVGDYAEGGEIFFDGFSGSDLYVKSFVVVDNDATEPKARLLVDGVQVAEAQQLGNGSVQTVTPTSMPLIGSTLTFIFGTAEDDGQTGSNAIDDLEICRQEEMEVGDEGCTLGYWSTHTGEGPGNQQNAWAATPYSTNDLLGDVFMIPSSYDLDEYTLLEALGFRGGPGTTAAARLLLKQAVAALLNASHPDVAYPWTSSEVISQVNSALQSGDRNTILSLKDQLDTFNDDSDCPLD